MMKPLACLVFLCIMLFTSCSFANKAGGSTATSQNTTAPENKTDTATKITETTAKSTVAETKKPVESALTLAGIKKAAQDKGYKVEVLEDTQLDIEPKPVDGFNMTYADENLIANVPVFEFKNAEDAKAYAKQVNGSGYNLCIINGKFLSMTGARYGITLNDNEKTVIETLLKSKVMEYVEPSPAPVKYTRDFAGAYSQIKAICTALDKLVNKPVLLYDKTLPNNDPKRLDNISFSLLMSGDLSFLAVLCEDQTKLDAIVQAWEMFGCTDVKLKHNAANDYTLTGKRAGLDTSFEIHCAYSPEKGSLLLLDKDGGEVVELYEFVPLGGDKYAIQTLYERCIIEYKDGKIISFIYSRNKTDKALAYDITKDGIYPNGQGTGEAWVLKNGEDSYEQSISFSGNKLKIAADSFMGDRLKAEINVK